jgi:hypothetical protein
MSKKFISDPKKENVIKNYVFTDLRGKIKTFAIGYDEPDMQLIESLSSKLNCCYSVSTEDKEMFFVKFYSSMAFNPLEDSSSYRIREWKWKKVSKKSFELYKKFLETKKTQFLKLVERLS